MKKQLLGKVVGIALVCLMVGAMLGGLLSSMAKADVSDLPATIRVKRVSLNRVDTVDFNLYVRRVLPHEWSEEWIRHWPDESLKAGAMAVKTYAWYWIDQGGRWPDADLRDDAWDRRYEEETFPRTDDAVEATWLIGMRNNSGQIFQSQYWDGRAVVDVGEGYHLNIRDNPGTSSTVIAQANHGDKLCVLSNGLTESGGFHWFFVKTGDITEWNSYTTGWVAGEYVNAYPGGQSIVNYANRMTQWGTVYWADQGKDYQWILSYFYRGIEFFDISGQPSPTITSSLRMVQSAPYYVGDTVTAQFTIANKGTASITFDVLTAGGRDPDNQVADFTWRRNITLDPSESYNYEGSLTLSKVGNYHFFCTYRTLDGTWNTSVPTESGVNNTLDISVEAAPKPDLIVEDIWTDPTEFYPGDTVKLYATIKNIGSGDAVGTFRTKRYFDGTYIAYYDKDGLAAGASYTSYATYTWPWDYSSHIIRVVADADGAITESNEGNNERSESFSAKSPTWESYRDADHNYVCNNFGDYATEHIVYMHGTGYKSSHNYRIAYYDGDGYKRQTHDVTSEADGNLSSQHTLSAPDKAGSWHAIVCEPTYTPPSTYNSSWQYTLADDDFTVQETAIPEFPTTLAAIVSLILCAGIYLWYRRKAALVPAQSRH